MCSNLLDPLLAKHHLGKILRGSHYIRARIDGRCCVVRVQLHVVESVFGDIPCSKVESVFGDLP